MKEGWVKLPNARKWHYFIENRSLCRQWLILGKADYELGNDDSPDNCATCQKKLIKLQELRNLE